MNYCGHRNIPAREPRAGLGRSAGGEYEPCVRKSGASSWSLNVAPTYTLAGRTVIGPANRDDGAERTAVLRGRRLDVKEGERVEVVGRLRVIDHKPAVVGGVFVPAWVEVRVAEE